VAGVSLGSVTSGFHLDTSVDGDTLVIHLYSDTPVSSSAGGSLAVVTFQIKANASGTAPINLAGATRLYDTNGLLDLHPEPTDGADSVDGSLNIDSVDALFGG